MQVHGSSGASSDRMTQPCGSSSRCSVGAANAAGRRHTVATCVAPTLETATTTPQLRDASAWSQGRSGASRDHVVRSCDASLEQDQDQTPKASATKAAGYFL